MTDKKTIAVAMSGGVDSSVAAYLLGKEGYEVSGVTFIMHEFTEDGKIAAENAANTCRIMGIHHDTISATDEFRRAVVDNFVSEYQMARTPNPCVVCNRRIKFPLLMNFADANGICKAATGHYAIIEKQGDRFVIKKAKDESKDQTYMLWGLTQDILSRLVLPLGNYSKPEIREIAETAKLPCAKSKDSQDICFIPDGDYISFLKEKANVSPVPGNYVDTDGKILGKHAGYQCYTIGQRKGLNISLGKHAFVLEKDASENKVILGDEENLFKKKVVARDINLIACDKFTGAEKLSAKVRYGKNAMPAVITQTGEDEITAEFDEPVRAPAPGQSLVIYDGDTLVGGGVIS